MNKRGFLLAEETLKIIIALISISFLVFFLASLYFTNVKQQKLEQAQQILKNSDESIQKNIANLKSGEEKEKKLVNPKGWYLFSFIEDKPNSCVGKSCMCICDYNINPLSSQENKCDSAGICLVVENLASFDEIKIEGLTKILIKKEGEKILISEKS